MVLEPQDFENNIFYVWNFCEIYCTIEDFLILSFYVQTPNEIYAVKRKNVIP